MIHARHPEPTSAFSVIELLVTLTILAILVGIVSVGAEDEIDRGRVVKVLDLLDTLEGACERYRQDTGQLAYEYTNYESPHRKLSAAQKIEGWRGPYLSAPLAHDDSNPYGSLHVYNDPLVNGWIPGFDVDGDGMVEATSGVNMLWLSGVDAGSARSLDAALDRETPGAWESTGRLRYDADARYVWILLTR